MTISVTGVAVRPIASASTTVAPPYDRGAAGGALTYIISCSSTVSLAGHNLYYNPALFRDPVTVEVPITNIPVFGFVVAYPSVGFPTTGTFAILPTPRSAQGANIISTINFTDAFTFEIVHTFILTADLNDFANDGSAPKQFRFTKNNILAPVILQNTQASVYNETRVLRAAIVTDDLGGTIDGIYYDHEFDVRWYESGLLGAPAEFTGWEYDLVRNGQIVTDLSIFEPTTIRFRVDNAAVGTIGASPHYISYREDSPFNGFGFFSDLSGSLYAGGVPLIQPSILSHSGWTLVGGTIYETTYEIDPSYFVLNGAYRFICVVFEGPGVAGFSNSFITPTLIVAAAPPEPTTGTMTGRLDDYNDTFGDCLNVAALERIRSCVEVDKNTYNTELATKGIDGSFDANFDNVRIVLAIGLSNQPNIIDINSNTGDPSLEIRQSANTFESCLTFRLPLSLLNTALQLTHIYTYNLVKDGLAYQDVIEYIQWINADILQEDAPLATQVITDISFKDSGGNVIEEICSESAELITVEVTKAATLDDYNLIAMVRRDTTNATPEEEESYNNNILPQLSTPIIDSVDALFVANMATFDIDPTQLSEDERYCVFAVAKKVNLTPPTGCITILMQTDTTVTTTGIIGIDEVTTLDIDFSISNFSPSTVTNVDISSITTGFNVAPNPQIDNFITDNGTYSYVVTFLGGFQSPALVQLVVDITLSNGCTYTGRIHLHSIIPIFKSFTQQITSEDAD